MECNTIISAKVWIDKIISERGIKQTRQLLTYNLTKNSYFKESNLWIESAWQRIKDIENSI